MIYWIFNINFIAIYSLFHNKTNLSILDLGFSKFEHREKFRIFANENQIPFLLHFLNISKEIRKERVVKRNSEKGSTFEFEVSESDFNFMESWFETSND